MFERYSQKAIVEKEFHTTPEQLYDRQQFQQVEKQGHIQQMEGCQEKRRTSRHIVLTLHS
ncbi:hypothetical protein [Lentibacillus juripiscarius]|uniref:hypothetical protein n=1 Tax=Lentibacillus juripiscarius TaxID=257446 RepID=UPI0036D3BB13